MTEDCSTEDWQGPQISVAKATFTCRCPRCGQGKLFSGLLEIRPACLVCGLDFSGTDTGDAFAVPILIVLGAIVVGAAFWGGFSLSAAALGTRHHLATGDRGAGGADDALHQELLRGPAIQDAPLRDAGLTQDISIRPKSSLLSASVATAIALAMLVWLGIWQIHRLHWKEGLLAQIAAAERTAPAELSGATPKLFTRVETHGVLRGDKVALYGAEVRGDRMGAQQAEILDRVGEKPLLVVLGWVPTDAGQPVPSGGPRDITGYIRLPEHPTWLSAADDLEARRFYTLNPATIAASLGATDAAPFTLVALRNPLGAALPPNTPQPADALPEPVNNHLEYALTWFGLAGALAGVFGVWAAKRMG